MSHSELHNTSLTFHVLAAPLSPTSQLDLFLQERKQQIDLPEHLTGDHTRLQQVLVNLIKILVKMCKRKPISILAAYDRRESKLQVQVIDEGSEIDASTLKFLQ